MGLFGATANETWSEFAAERGAVFHAGGFFAQPRVEWRHELGTVVLETFYAGKMVFTRISLDLPGSPPFTCNIRPRHFLSSVGDALGRKRILTGNLPLDERFTVQGGPETAVLRLMRDEAFAAALLEQPKLHIRLLGTRNGIFNSGPPRLEFTEKYIVTGRARLDALFDLFVAMTVLVHPAARTPSPAS
jgi:hypothetical protein